MATDLYLTRSFGFLLADVSRLVRQRFDARATQLGLTRAQWRVLAQLRRREGITQAALAEILEIEPITLVRHIDRLEMKGLVERRVDPNDRRARNLYLREDAQPMMDQMRVLSEQTREEVLGSISSEDHEKLVDLLLTIKETVNELPPVPRNTTAKQTTPGAARPVRRRARVGSSS
jgi:MarR family transcriptional regulator, transcriptional regulator for hemolysin